MVHLNKYLYVTQIISFLVIMVQVQSAMTMSMNGNLEAIIQDTRYLLEKIHAMDNKRI